MNTKFKVQVYKGKVTQGREKLVEHMQSLPDGAYMVSFYSLLPKNEEEWRKLYFLLRDTLYEDGGTGYTKTELHEMAKAQLLLQINQDEGNIKDVELKMQLSTKNLTEKGWQEFVTLFKEWAFESFECYL